MTKENSASPLGLGDYQQLEAAHSFYHAALSGDWFAVEVMGDFYQECEMIEPGKPYYIDGPLDITIGIVKGITGAFLEMEPGCATTREVANTTRTVASGKPEGTNYAIHPLGRIIPLLAITGLSEIPKFLAKDWPSQG